MVPHPADINDDQWEKLSDIDQDTPDISSGEIEQRYLRYCDYYRRQTKSGTPLEIIHKAAFVRTRYAVGRGDEPIDQLLTPHDVVFSKPPMNHHPKPFSEKRNNRLCVLADPYCRSIITYFQQTESDRASINNLAIHISENEIMDKEQIRRRLQQSALPRLEDLNIINHEGGRGIVRYKGIHS